MLGIFELIFFIAGMYILITGKLPQKEFGTLFGKGKYELSSGSARLWGLLLILPGPSVICVLILSLILFGKEGLVAAILFEIATVIFVGICSVIIARKVRLPLDEAAPQKQTAAAYHPANYSTVQSPPAQPSAPAYQPMGEPLMYSSVQSQPEKPKKSYGMRLLIMTALVVTGCITVTFFTSTIGTLVSGLVYGMRWTGDFMQDVFPMILGLGISALGIWGILKLIKLLK